MALVGAHGAELRRSKPADRGALVAMYRSFEPKGTSLGLPPRWKPEKWLARLAAYPNFIAVVEGRVVGHAVLCPEGNSAEVAIFVHQDSRRHGLGKRLLNKLKNEGQRLGLRRLWGITEPDNLAMLRLAVSLGFVLSAEPGEFYIKFEQRTEAIRRRAYEIYLTRGGGPGREMEDWLQAEGEFFSASAND